MSPRSLNLLLASTPGIGGKTLVRIVARNGLLQRSPNDFLSFPKEIWVEEYRMAAKSAAWLDARRAEYAKSVPSESELAALGMTWITAADAGYPELIEQFDSDPPGVLFLYGNHRLIRSETVSVLASRGCTARDLDRIEGLAESHVLAGRTMVSGHDRPEYQRAAVVPLRWGAPRILVFDRGHMVAMGERLTEEPFRSARLWRYQFDPTTDLAISPFLPRHGFIGANNRIRDRLVASLSRYIDVVRLSAGGNMERIARMALRAGRQVRIPADCEMADELQGAGAEILPDPS